MRRRCVGGWEESILLSVLCSLRALRESCFSLLDRSLFPSPFVLQLIPHRYVPLAELRDRRRQSSGDAVAMDRSETEAVLLIEALHRPVVVGGHRANAMPLPFPPLFLQRIEQCRPDLFVRSEERRVGEAG